MRYPRMLRVRQAFARPRIEDVPGAVRTGLAGLDLERVIRPGETVALTAGSRGIADIVAVLRTIVQFLHGIEARPFILPAMGSHGGATAEGQTRVLAGYGITADSIGAPVRASMEVVRLGRTDLGFPVVVNRLAAEAAHIGIINRVKPHTAFHGPVESGLLKMMMIGLGNHEGAQACHRFLREQPLELVARSITRAMRDLLPITFGAAIVENAHEEVARLEILAPEDFEAMEERLLTDARRWLARLPVASADLLIVDEIGKNISGSGMDTNVVGRKRAARGQALDGQPSMRHIFVRGLSAKSHGNAYGIGLADMTTLRLIGAMDYQATVLNGLTANYADGAFLPLQFETDREAIDAALGMMESPERAHILHIRNTNHLSELEMSEPCFAEAPKLSEVTAISDAYELGFDGEGNLKPFSVVGCQL